MREMFSFFAILLALQVADLPTKKVSDYQQEWRKLESINKALADKNFYDNIEFKDRKTNKIKKFSEFSKFDQSMFRLKSIENFNKYLEQQENLWRDELKQLKDNKVQDSGGNENAIAGVDDVTKFIDDLSNLHKKVVQNWEDQANKIFKEFPKEFEESEKNLYLKKIKIIKEK